MRTAHSLVALAAVASSLAAQKLVLPDNHNFMEATTYGTNTGSANEWSASASHFQILYEASHFTGKAGVLGPMLITHVKFRGEDGESNLGGQVYTGITISIGSTTLTAATMSTTFNTNRLPATTILGPSALLPSLFVAPSVGSCPNNYCIDIDLTAIGAAWVHDPTGPFPNLLIDIGCPTAPTNPVPFSLIPIQNTTAHGAGIRGKAIYTSSLVSATGSIDAAPPVVGLEFVGPGGQPTEMPAKVESIGGGCGGAHATFYELFSQDQPFDLVGGLTLIPDVYPSPNTYMVLPGAPPVDASKLNAVVNSSADDALVTWPLVGGGGSWSMPFSYPGGSTPTIKPCTNGFVWLDATMTASPYEPTKGNILGTAANYRARLMPYCADLWGARNSGLTPLAGLHVQDDTTGGFGNTVTYVTWYDMGSYRTPGSATIYGHAVWTFQCVLFEATGMVQYRYGPMQPFNSSLWGDTLENAAVVGFTRGRISTAPLVTSRDPLSRDLSFEVPFSTAIEGSTSNVALTGVATPIGGSVLYSGRMFGGQSLKWNIANIPAGTLIAWTLLDLGAVQPGSQFPPFFGITAPGCLISTSLSPVFIPWEQFLFPGATATGVNTLLIPHGWEGVTITAQAIGIDVFGGPYLIPWSSNALKYTVGLD